MRGEKFYKSDLLRELFNTCTASNMDVRRVRVQAGRPEKGTQNRISKETQDNHLVHPVIKAHTCTSFTMEVSLCTNQIGNSSSLQGKGPVPPRQPSPKPW